MRTSREKVEFCCQLIFLVLVSFANFYVTGLSNDICSCEEADETNFIQIQNIPESLSEGSVIKRFNFTDVDKIFLRALLPSSITFNNLTQELKIRKKFNITESTPLLLDNIKLICEILATGQEIEYKLLLEVHDENDNAPIFTNLPYLFDVSEATPHGSNVSPEITAVDADPSDSGKLTYGIKVTDEYSEYFNFTVPSSGKLTLMRELNYDLVKHIYLSVFVKDNSYNESILGIPQAQHVVWTSITINVASVFGEALQTLNNSYSLSVSNLDMDIVIDPSFQNKSELEFSLINDKLNDGWKYFQLTNSVRLRAVNNPTKSFYILFMKAKKRVKSTFVVSCIFLNILKPAKLLNSFISLVLAENTKVGTFVAKMETINSRNGTKFYFLDTSSETEYFNLDQSSGVITIKKDLTSIVRKEINLYVGLLDRSENTSDNGSLNIVISSIAESSPKFVRTFYEFTLFNATWIGQVQALSNSTFPIKYRLLDQHRKFSIDQTGLIKCTECTSINDSTIALVVIAELETPYNRSDSALILIHHEPKSYKPSTEENWLLAFIISIILACIFFITFLFFIAITCISSKRVNAMNQNHHQSPEGLTFEKFKGGLALKRIQKTIFTSKTRNAKQKKNFDPEVRSVSSDVPQMETSSMRILVHREPVPSDNSIERLGFYPCIEACKKQDRLDWTSSQDTINASNMTLTRPAVGTNGITLYY